MLGEDFPAEEEVVQPIIEPVQPPEVAAGEAVTETPQVMVENAEHPVDEPEATATERATQIAVTDGNENAFPNRIDDPKKAYNVANESKVEHDQGAESRVAARAARADAAREKERGEGIMANFYEGKAEDMEDRAARQEARAAAIEEWAGILYDHPVDEKFKEKYPGVQFTAAGLVAAERRIGELADRYEATEEQVENLSPAEILMGMGSHNNIVVNISKISEIAGDEAGGAIEKEWNELVGNPETSLGALKDFYMKQHKEYVLGPMRAEISIGRGFLEELRSGRTAAATSAPVTA